MIEIGLVGCGAVVHDLYSKALTHRDAYSVRFVCDRDPVQAASAARLFHAEVMTLEALTDRAAAVIVSTPPATHAAIVRACLGSGRTVLCEKPFTTTRDDAAGICDEARDIGASVFINHFRRVFPQLELARELIGLGLIGETTAFSASEGGRFVWKAVSQYTTRDPSGGVLWDTGSHTLDMALFAAGLDANPAIAVQKADVQRDRSEPSHEFRAVFNLSIDGRDVEARLNLSRKTALPNLVVISGTLGEVAFVTQVDDRVRLSTSSGSTIVHAGHSYRNGLECFDVQFKRVLLRQGAEAMAADNFIGQIGLLEALACA